MSSILQNLTIASVGRVVHILLGLVAQAITARLLLPEGLGLFLSVLSLGIILQLLADSGLYLSLSRHIAAAKSDQDRQQQISLHISSRLFLSLVIFTISSLAIYAVPAWHNLFTIFIILSLGLISQSLSQMLMALFQYHRSIWRAVAGDTVGRLIQLAILALAWFSLLPFSPIISVTLAFTAGAITALATHLTLSRNQKILFTFMWVAQHGAPATGATAPRRGAMLRQAPPQLKTVFFNSAKLVKKSWPLAAMLILNAIYFRTDILMLSWLQGTEEAGFYGFSYRIIESALFFPAMFGGLLLPRLTEAITNKKLLKKYIQESLHLVTFATGGMLVVLIAAGPDIIHILGGSAFIPSLPLLSILSLALAAMFFGNIFGNVLIAAEKQFTLVKIYAALVVVNITLNAIFIPTFGAHAAAWTTVVTEALSLILAMIATQNVIPEFRLWRNIRDPVIKTVLLTSILIVAFKVLPSLPAPSSLILVAALYLAFSHLFGTWSLKQLKLLRSPSS